MAKAFISDADMEKLESSKPSPKNGFISDEEMSALESDSQPQDGGFDWNSPVYSAFKGAAGAGLAGLQKVGETVDRFSGAPTRAGLLAAVKSDSGDLIGAGKNAFAAAKSQFGEDPSLAPTGEQILEESGVPESYKMRVGPNFNEVDVPIRKIGGFATDIVADPINLVPAGKLSGLIGKGAKAIEEAPNAMKAFSEGKAIKQAGGMLKDFRRIMGKGRSEDVGQALLRETVGVADESGKIKSVPLLKAGDEVEDVAQKSGLLKQQTGEKIGQIYKDIDNKVTDMDFLRKLSPEEFKKVATSERFEPNKAASELSQMISEKYGKKIDGQKVVARANEILDQVSKRGNSLEDALALKGELDEMVNYSKQTQELPAIQQALVDIRNSIRDKTNKYVDSVAGVLDVENGKELRRLNKLYGNVAEVEKMASDKVARNSANRMLSPSDYFVGGTGAGIGALAGGPAGFLAGAAAGVANKVARERGAGILARGADLGARATGDIAPMAAEGIRSLRELDRPGVRGLLKKAKRKDDE